MTILVTPIPADEDEYTTPAFPVPHERDLNDYILVFPADAGMEPIYVYLSEENGYDPAKSREENAPNSSEQLPWDSWQNYQKVTIDGRQYAQIGDRMYSQHAVDRMQPSGLGSPAGTSGPGRNITPNMVESVIKSGTPQNSVVNGVTRTTYWSGDVGVVTEKNSNVIVTILCRSGQ